jgi:hypothetical protein
MRRQSGIKMSVIQSKVAEGVDGRLIWLEEVRRQVESLRFGVVQIVVHDSRVTQIEKTERLRLDQVRSKSISS